MSELNYKLYRKRQQTKFSVTSWRSIIYRMHPILPEPPLEKSKSFSIVTAGPSLSAELP